jgi:hypothetical protein
MYISAWGLGLAAMLVLTAFRPFPRSRLGMAPV